MDDAAFTRIDGKLFDRLHRGALDPLSFRLKDGRTVAGQLVAIRRFGAVGDVVGMPAGEIRLDGASGTTTLSYGQIDDIE